MTTTIHVSLSGSDSAPGTVNEPLRTINRAAQIARPGDTVQVHEGTYREWVRPPRGGLSNQRRITFEAAPGERVKITGAEIVTNWEETQPGVWKAVVNNELFGEFNPFSIEIEGDWLVRPYLTSHTKRHLGAVYLNGKNLLEVDSITDVAQPQLIDSLIDDWTGTEVYPSDPERISKVWFATVTPDVTEIYANFGDANPHDECVEINVRPAVFFPTVHHVNWITVRGFEIAQAATQWAPPTAFQEGMIGPNWAKGWIIEDNNLHDSKCVAVSLGKERTSGHNYATIHQNKPGYQYQLESVFSARQIGWDEEHIGSHVVRRNHIHHCGQAAIVGHLGCIFSTIENNHIHDIALERQFYGHEIAGIKLHAAIDVQIIRNHIHDCSLGIWMDWQTQGTRISRNILHRNSRDLFIEVSHGPYVVDNNVLASKASIENVSQGGAYLHNIIGGTVRLEPVMDRATPYHRAHSTQVSGFALIVGGDDRWIGNIFFAGDLDSAYVPGGFHHQHATYGTVGYEGYPESFEAYMREVSQSESDHERYYGRKLPAYIRDNVYLGGAKPYSQEIRATVLDEPGALSAELTTEGGALVRVKVPAHVAQMRIPRSDGNELGYAHFPDVEFEDATGAPLSVDKDLTGRYRSDGSLWAVGPFNSWDDEGKEIQIFLV